MFRSTPVIDKRMRVLTRDRVRVAIQIALISLGGYFVGAYLTRAFNGESASIGGLWSASYGIAVLQATTQETWKEGSRQVLGMLIGATTSALYLSLFPFSPIGMAIVGGLTVLLCELLGLPDASKLAAGTVVIIMVVSSENPTLNPLINSALRFCEACLGAGIALLTTLLPPRIVNAA